LILALCDRELVNFEIEGLKSESASCGHRFFGKSKFKVESIEDYFEKVRANNVIIDIEERKKKIRDLIEAKCTKTGEKVLIEEELLSKQCLHFKLQRMCLISISLGINEV
jgi:glycyl-tRNA synthetase beta chain